MQDGLESRVEKLERENRWLKRGALVALVAVGGVTLMGQTSGPMVSDEVRTRRLVVVDEAGKVRVGLAMTATGPSICLNDETGKVRASLAATKYGPILSLHGETEMVRADLVAWKDGPALSLYDQAGYSAKLGAMTLFPPKTGTTTERSAASLVMFGKDGDVIWKAPE